MSSFLCFWLHGPMCSWGDTAVGEVRPSRGHPGKSAVLGLVAGALGIERFDQAGHDALHQGLALAVLVAAPGLPLVDFHTVEPPRRRKGVSYATRRDEVLALDERDNPIVSQRHYYCDAHYAVALWRRPQASCAPLTEMAQALEQPVFVPYLGRKSCPLSLPMNPLLVEAEDVSQALLEYLAQTQVAFRKHGLGPKIGLGPLSLLSDDEEAILRPSEGDQVFTSRDANPQHKRWQFGLRRERRRSLAWSGLKEE